MKKFWKIIKIALLIFIGIPAVSIVLVAIFSGSKTTTKSEPIVKIEKFNADSVAELIKFDKLFEIKDTYYDPKDSSLKIAFTNRQNIIKDGNYSTQYFDNTYRINDHDCFDGVYLFAYQKGKYLKDGDYKKYLACNSKRAGRLMEVFKDNFCVGDKECTAISGCIKKQLKDPDSYESDKIFITWLEADRFKVVNRFRAKNGFAALVLNECTAIVDVKGNVYDLKLNE